MQGRGTTHFQAAVHFRGAPKLDIDSDSSYRVFADKYFAVNYLMKTLILNFKTWFPQDSVTIIREHLRKTNKPLVDLATLNVPLNIHSFLEYQQKKMQMH